MSTMADSLPDIFRTVYKTRFSTRSKKARLGLLSTLVSNYDINCYVCSLDLAYSFFCDQLLYSLCLEAIHNFTH